MGGYDVKDLADWIAHMTPLLATLMAMVEIGDPSHRKEADRLRDLCAAQAATVRERIKDASTDVNAIETPTLLRTLAKQYDKIALVLFGEDDGAQSEKD